MLLTLMTFAALTPLADTSPTISFKLAEGRLHIAIDGKPFADYVFQDETVRRPYLAHVRAPGGLLVTRNHPPVKGKDASDHATMHPGIWLAFGDLGGADFWRNRGIVRHAGFVEKPEGGKGRGRFAVRNRYESAGRIVCEEVCRLTVRAKQGRTLLVWESAFSGPGEFSFGDQEEMGLGVRVATPLTVKNGGRIASSEGQTNERQVWGKQADWCDYSGVVEGKRVGVTLMPDPANFRRSWFHARDYGLLVANPFGRNAFTRGAKSRVVVKKGETFRLRFGVLIHSGEVDLKQGYRDFKECGHGQATRPRDAMNADLHGALPCRTRDTWLRCFYNRPGRRRSSCSHPSRCTRHSPKASKRANSRGTSGKPNRIRMKRGTP